MKTFQWTLTLILAAGAWRATGQTAVDLSRQGKVGTGTTLPAHCTVGQIFFNTTAPAGTNLFACTTPNGWVAVGLPTLAGDASGTQQSVTVQAIQGHSVSATAPADQNVLRWNAATGLWQPGMVPATGAAAPPGTCTAGSLYLQSDTTNNIQQMYVCSNTNTWVMASTRSGTAANRPANCVAGQTWLSTDTGAMTYCSATGNPGTWSATLAGPAGANGSTIWNGSAAPSAGTGANGDFYLNTATDCLYGPKASGAWPGTCTSLVGPQGPAGNSPTWTTVAFSATPTFAVSAPIQGFQMTLTGNVTSSSFSGTLQTGQLVIFKVCQNSAGAHTFAPPSKVVGFGSLDTTASVCNTQAFQYDGTNLNAITPMRTDNPLPQVSAVNGIYSLPSSPTTLVGTTDSRLSNARTPTAHASTHQNGGADEIATATAAANAIPKAGSGGRLAMGWLASGTPNGTQFVRDDGTLAVPPGGNSQSLVEPVQNSALGGGFQTGVSLLTYQSGLTNPIDYGNLTPFGVESYIFNGRNIQSDKKSIAGLYSFAYPLAAGQTVGLNTTITHPGVGDTLGVAANVYCQGFTTASGDEGCEGYAANIYGPRNLLIAPISTSTASACSTTLAASVVKSQAPTDVKTFQVASTTGCNINDWVTLDNGVFESTDSSVENVQITAVGAGPCPGASCTLSALLQSPHSTGAPLAGSRVLSSSGYMDKQQGWGQGRIVVDNSATQVTAGTASNAGGTTITGAGTSWSTGMVGGNANLPGCFRFLADDDTRDPWGGGNTLHQWWPIQSVSNSGTLILSRIYAGPPRSGASYAIAPCGRIGAIAMSYGTTSETITGIVLDNTSLSWTVGHNMEQAISPYASYQRGMSVVWNSATSLLGHGPIMFDATNGGYGRSPAVLQAEQSAAIDSSTAAGYFYGINLIGNTSAGKITLPGKDLSGLALGIRTYNDGGIPDPGLIQWSRGPSSSGDGFILPNVTSGQFMMGTSTSKVQFSDDSGHPGFGVLWDYSAPVAASHLATITIPDASGNICLSTTCVTSTPLTRNLPDGTSLNEVDIGSWTNSGGQGEIYGQICVYDNATSNRPCKVYSFAVPWNGADYTWKQVVPVNEALSGDGFDYALDVQSVSGVVSARLRNSGTTHHSGVAAMDLLYGGQVTPNNTFTPSTATASVSAPTQVLANTVVKQSANKLGIVNASGFTATLDPTALTADRTITQPDLAGTMALSGSSQLVSFGNLAAGSGTYVQSSDPGCANTGQIGRFWFDTTTTTTVLKACMNVAGTLTWVTK